MTRQLKSILILALTAMMTLGVLCGSAYAGNDNSCGQGLTWKLNKGVLTISGAGVMDDYNMRSSRWGGDYTKIEKVVISEGVTHIGAYAFFNCSYLTSVTIADSVTSIGNNAFQSCNVLETLSIPNQVQTIGTYAFNNCWCLTGVAIPEGITRIESNTFSYCNNLEQITIPDSVTYIGDGAFNNCAKLNSITYNGAQAEWESISIGSNNTGLTGASINCLTADGGSCGTDVRWSLSNDGELTISGSGAMSSFSTADDVPWKSHASSIHSVSIGDEVTNIEDFAFANCGELASVDLPSSLNAIGVSAFYSCYGLKDISIPAGTKTIGQNAFADSGLESITIPDSVTSIGSDAFSSQYLATVYYSGGEEAWQGITILDGNERLTGAYFFYNGETEHSWGEASYAWNEDHSEVTATRVCDHDANHVETETVGATSEITKEATCEENGETTYISAAFTNEAFEEQVLNLADIPAAHALSKHEKTEATCITPGTEAYWECSVCEKLFSDGEGREMIEEPVAIPAKGHTVVVDAAVAATCIEEGKSEGKHCSICGIVIIPQETLSATGDPGIVACNLTAGTPVENERNVRVIQTALRDGIVYSGKQQKLDNGYTRFTLHFEVSEGLLIRVTDGSADVFDYTAASAGTSLVNNTLVVDIPGNNLEGRDSFNVQFISSDQMNSISITADVFYGENADLFDLDKMSVLYLPGMLTTIEDGAFEELACEAVVVPNNCISIGNHAFRNCRNLKYIRVPVDTEIASDAFEGCENVSIERVANE